MILKIVYNLIKSLKLTNSLKLNTGECLPYCTVLNLGIKKSEFRWLWLANNTLKRWIIFPVINLNFTVYIRIAISCKRLF